MTLQDAQQIIKAHSVPDRPLDALITEADALMESATSVDEFTEAGAMWHKATSMISDYRGRGLATVKVRHCEVAMVCLTVKKEIDAEMGSWNMGLSNPEVDDD